MNNFSNLIEEIEAMSIWKPASVDQQPGITLIQWMIMECKIEGEESRTRHLVGYDLNNGCGRVSSAVKTHVVKDKVHLFETNSGRTYRLSDDRKGMNSDAVYVWGAWVGRNQAADIADVTDEYSA